MATVLVEVERLAVTVCVAVAVVRSLAKAKLLNPSSPTFESVVAIPENDKTTDPELAVAAASTMPFCASIERVVLVDAEVEFASLSAKVSGLLETTR